MDHLSEIPSSERGQVARPLLRGPEGYFTVKFSE